MQFPKESHRAAMKQYLRYLRGSTTLGLFFKHACSDIPRLIGYLDSSHNIDLDDGRNTAGHIFYFGESLITWCTSIISKNPLRYLRVRLSSWQEPRQQGKLYGSNSC